MGCDIHLYVERKNQDGQWVTADKWVANEDEASHVDYNSHFYSGRNYNLFSILADVRNGRGFAGIKTGEGFNPISEPRGVPDDACAEYKQKVENWDCDGHSHSYHTLADLLNYDWTQGTQLQGWVDMETYCKWKQSQSWDSEVTPSSYAGSVTGSGIKHIELAEADTIFDNFVKMPFEERKTFLAKHASKYVLVTWQVAYYTSGATFLSTTIPKLLKLAGSVEHLNDVRICFFFDN